MPDPARFVLRRLSFTGPRVPLADIEFVPGRIERREDVHHEGARLHDGRRIGLA
jgi:hypothetical protein